MGTGLQGEPNVYTAGNDFDYSVWTAGTRIDLVNVNWNNDYRDVVKFSSKSALNSYINNAVSAGVTIQNMTYVKPNQDVHVPIPYNRVNRFNYLRASNPLMPIENDVQKDYYYFILDVEYVNPQTSRLRLQLDIWQTFVYDVQFGNCYIERGHIGIANENAFNNYGRDYLTVPEGLDIGADYRTIVTRTDEVIGFEGLTQKTNVLVVSTTDLLQDPGTKSNPNMNTGPGSTISGLASGATFYAFESPQSFGEFLNDMKEYPWITQGIVSVTIVPELNRYMPGGSSITFSPSGIPTRLLSYWPYPVKHKMFTGWRDNTGFKNKIPEKYRHLRKFFTYPYMSIELTTWSGTPITLRPEAWADPDAFVLERTNFIPPNQRVQFTPRRYNSNGDPIEPLFNITYSELISLGFTDSQANAFLDMISEMGDDGGDYLDMITQIGDFPTMPVVNNMAINYLAANAHSINYQRTSADWAQQRAMASAQAGYDVQSGAIRAATDLTNISQGVAGRQVAIQNAALMDQAAIQGLAGLAGNTVGGAAFGPAGAAVGLATGAASAAAGIASASVQQGANIAGYANSSTGAFDTTARNNQQAALARDTNVDLARFAAKGDYANAIAGINAKVQDAALIQPSISGQFGGDTVNLANGTMEFSIRWKLLDEANLKIVGDYWLMFGYAIRAFITPPQSLRVMTKFSYWKMNATYLSGATVPENHKQVIRGILEKGVTVWVDPDDIGNIDIADNTPLAGVSY